MPLQFTTSDVFTDTPFEGNQLAIVQLSEQLPSSMMQNIAKEFDYQETIFIHPESQPNVFPVNIFTPFEELPFAGHPTIGAADFILQNIKADSATLLTKAGPIAVRTSNDGVIKADIPHNFNLHKLTVSDLPLPAGLTISDALKTAPIVSIVKGMTFALIRLPSIEALSKVEKSPSPLDLSTLLDPEWNEGLVGKYYYVVDEQDENLIRTRMILSDIIEDPATGSAATALGSYLALTRGANQKIQITQGVEIARKSVIGVEVELDDENKQKIKSVVLSGKSVVIAKGQLMV